MWGPRLPSTQGTKVNAHPADRGARQPGSGARGAARTSSSQSSAWEVDRATERRAARQAGRGHRRYQRPAQAAALSPRPGSGSSPDAPHVQAPPAHLQPLRVHGAAEAGPRASGESRGPRAAARPRPGSRSRARGRGQGRGQRAGRGGVAPPLAAAGRAVRAAGIAGRRRDQGRHQRGRCAWRRGRRGCGGKTKEAQPRGGPRGRVGGGPADMKLREKESREDAQPTDL